MKKIEAFIRPFKLEDIKAALADVHIEGMTVTEVQGMGQENGHTEVYRGNSYTVDFQPQIKVEIVLPNDRLTEAVAAIVKAVRASHAGDGELFISSVENAIRIRTEETGDQAV